MEKFTGTGAGSIPAHSFETGYNLEKSYSDLLGDMSVRFLTQGALKTVFGSPAYDFGTDRMKFYLTHSEILANAIASAPTDAADKAVYWSEIARTLLDYATNFGTTTAAMQTAINTAAGSTISVKPLGGWIIEGTAGNDVLTGTSAHGYITGEAGNDSLSGLGGNDMLNGSLGMDTLRGGTGNDGLDGGQDNDTYTYARGDGDDWITDLGGSTQDTLIFENIARNEVTFVRTTEPSTAYNITTTDQTTLMILVNGGGSVALTRQLYNDSVIELVKFSDGTTMTAQQIKDVLPVIGTAGNDTLFGDGGNNIISGAAGDDQLIGGAGDDSLNGDTGNDTIWGELGNDTINGGDGLDALQGSDGADSIDGGASNDDVQGNAGNDSVSGGAGNDMLWGQDGDDRVSGNAGKDQMTGGLGIDTFFFTNAADNQAANADYIWDFVHNVDKINVQGLGFLRFDTDGGLTEAGELRLSGSGITTIVSDQTGFTFQFNGTFTTATLTNSDFIW